MDSFVVETYLSRHVDGEPAATIARVEAAARRSAASGDSVRFVRTIFIPDDESCLFLLEATSAAAIERVLAAAALSSIRIAHAVAIEGDVLVGMKRPDPGVDRAR